MSEHDREKWNARYAGPDAAHAAPSPFLTGLDPLLPRSGRALDVAGGTGRHALWLAARGLAVTLVDVSDVALALAREAAARAGHPLDTRRVDVEEEPLPAGPWDLALVFNFLHRPLLPALAQALGPGGLLVVAHP